MGNVVGFERARQSERDVQRARRRMTKAHWLLAGILIGAAAGGYWAVGLPRNLSTAYRLLVIDKDCSDFSTHAQAQAFFEAQGPGDPHRLDRDHDGSACETLP